MAPTSANLVGKDLVESIAVILEGHSAVWLNIFHFNVLVKIYYKLPLRVDLQTDTQGSHHLVSLSLTSLYSHLHKDLLLVHGFDDFPDMRSLFLQQL